MEVSTRIEEDIFVVRVAEARIDAQVALSFKEAMRTATADAGPLVVLDLQMVQFVDSSGLGAIVATMKHLAPDRELVLAGLTPAVDKVFRLTRMDRVFNLYPTLEDALRNQNV